MNDPYGIEHDDMNNYDRDDSSSSFHRDTSYINSGKRQFTIVSLSETKYQFYI